MVQPLVEVEEIKEEGAALFSPSAESNFSADWLSDPWMAKN